MLGNMKEKQYIFYKIKNIIANICTLVFLFFAIIILVQRISNDSTAFLGLKMYRVQTGSMIPKYQIGDVIMVIKKDVSKIKVGDDLVYEGMEGDYKDKIVTHQVIDIEEENGEYVFHTKGIANSSEDPIVSASQVKGVVLHRMIVLTYFYKLLDNKYILYFAIIVPLTIYVFFTLIHSNINKKER